jgi:hypothetical protein
MKDFHEVSQIFFASGLWCGNDVIGETKKLLEIETLTASTHFVEQLSRTSKEGIDQLKYVLLITLLIHSETIIFGSILTTFK